MSDPILSGAIFRIVDPSVLRSPVPTFKVPNASSPMPNGGVPTTASPKFGFVATPIDITSRLVQPQARFGDSAIQPNKILHPSFEALVRASPIPKVGHSISIGVFFLFFTTDVSSLRHQCACQSPLLQRHLQRCFLLANNSINFGDGVSHRIENATSPSRTLSVTEFMAQSKLFLL
jgi:hypothetical protein